MPTARKLDFYKEHAAEYQAAGRVAPERVRTILRHPVRPAR